MGKIKNNQKGFGVVEAILILVILILIGAVGYLVYKSHHKTSAKVVTITKTTTAAPKTLANPYTGWLSYKDSSLDFKYPSNWQIIDKADGYEPQSDAELTGPSSTPPSYFVVPNPNAHTLLDFSFFTSPQDPPLGSGCTAQLACAVNVVTPLHIQGFPNAKLVVYSDDPGPAEVTQYIVVNSSSQKIGDSDIVNAGLNGNIYLSGCTLRVWSMGEVCAQVSNFASLQSSSDYKNLVNVLNSLTLN